MRVISVHVRRLVVVVCSLTVILAVWLLSLSFFPRAVAEELETQVQPAQIPITRAYPLIALGLLCSAPGLAFHRGWARRVLLVLLLAVIALSGSFITLGLAGASGIHPPPGVTRALWPNVAIFAVAFLLFGALCLPSVRSAFRRPAAAV
jgi:hypothetical protein